MILIQRQKYKSGKKQNGLLDCSGTKLALGLNIPIYTPKISYKKSIPKKIINFGCSNIPWLLPEHVVINNPEAIHAACDKLLTFKLLANEVPVPTFNEDKEIAASWFDKEGTIVFCRTLINASQGRGIIVARSKEELVNAPLYTLYIPKKEEYRVHVAFGKVIHIQKKKKLSEEERIARGITETNKLIRNLSNGYIFSTNFDAPLNDDGSYEDTKFFWLVENAIHAVRELGLHFGAVDMVVGKDGKVYTLEVNTAPRLEEPTLSKYINAINENLS
jgi:hypothetical protein